MAKKKCRRCAKFKPTTEFYRQPASRDGLRTWCKKCCKSYYDEWRSNNRHRLNDLIRASKFRQKGIAVTVDEITAMEQKQDGCCAICGKQETLVRENSRSVLSLDHCHSTGRVRGLLCRRCNTGIANFDDDPERLLAAVKYLTMYKTVVKAQ